LKGTSFAGSSIQNRQESAKCFRRRQPTPAWRPRRAALDVTLISSPVPMRAGGVFRPLSIAGGLQGADAPGEQNTVTVGCTPSCAVLPRTMVPVMMRKGQYMAFGRLRLQVFIPPPLPGNEPDQLCTPSRPKHTAKLRFL
jgi:hypothetical protein